MRDYPQRLMSALPPKADMCRAPAAMSAKCQRADVTMAAVKIALRAMAPHSPQDNDLSTHAHAFIQVHNVLVVHAKASVRDESADRSRIVGAVDGVLTSAAQGQRRRAHRI